MEKVYCVHCGAALDVYARFCRSCGEKTLISPALIRLATEKDQQAITELYERTYQDVYHTVRSVIHDEDTALDILQDAYIKGFESLDQLNDPRSYLPWMKRIAVNRAKNELKRKKPMLFTDMENEDGDELPFQDEREEHLPDVVIDKQETTRLINEMLGTLSEEQRMVIGMFYYEQMSVKEIAAELGCSENTVKSRLNYGRKKIETQVLDLEKRGTKLYSLSPVLFLLLLFRNMAGQPTDIPAQQILSNIQGSVGAQTAAQIGSAAGQEAARTGAKAAGEAAKQGFLHTVAGKVVAGIAAVALIGGATVGAVQLTQNNSTQAEPVTEAAEIQPEPVEELSEEPTPQEEPAVITETPPEEVTPEEQPVVEQPEPEEPEETAVPDWQIAYTAFLPELHETVAEIVAAEQDYSCADYGYSLQEGLPCEYALFDLSGDGIPEIVAYALLYGRGNWFVNYIFSYDGTEVYRMGELPGSMFYPQKSEATRSLLLFAVDRFQGGQYCNAYSFEDGECIHTTVYADLPFDADTDDYLGEYADHTELDWYDVDDFDGTLTY
ncbi:MAG: sigma-70 family RNA polymerase sigma factor [Oscillospiraceae bacterium]|nr:sigma-70 family RNA polymerase sigma factor [Oscillospiraceae bacterium]